MINLGVRVETSGPLLTPSVVGKAITAMLSEVVDKVAQTGRDMVEQACMDHFRDPTPYYWTRLDVTELSADTRVVHDNDVVYGPWLEGISSRNASTSFKGYHMWRTTRAALADAVPTIVEPIVTQHLRGLG